MTILVIGLLSRPSVRLAPRSDASLWAIRYRLARPMAQGRLAHTSRSGTTGSRAGEVQLVQGLAAWLAGTLVDANGLVCLRAAGLAVMQFGTVAAKVRGTDGLVRDAMTLAGAQC